MANAKHEFEANFEKLNQQIKKKSTVKRDGKL